MRTLPTLAVCLGALGCTAALAQTTAGPNGPQNAPSPPFVTGAPTTHAGEPSAATPGSAAAGTRAGVSRRVTQAFITQIAYVNQAEIAGARYALAHSGSADIRRFARQMIADHSKVNGELKQIAYRDGYTAPTGLDTTDREALMRLERDHGAQFDAAYASSQDMDHTEVLAQFKRAEQNTQLAPAVRRFAQMNLPMLQDHLQMANRLADAHAQGDRPGRPR